MCRQTDKAVDRGRQLSSAGPKSLEGANPAPERPRWVRVQGGGTKNTVSPSAQNSKCPADGLRDGLANGRTKKMTGRQVGWTDSQTCIGTDRQKDRQTD